ncbi:ABC transporter ATP-binding protein [Frateuria aurantia]
MIEAHQLRKAYGDVEAVRDVSFRAGDGQITGLLGPNGAGKTTTLRMLYSLARPDHGTVRIDGIDAAVDPLGVRRRIGVLPDAHGLYKRLTARENIDYFARLQGVEPAIGRSRAQQLIHELGMEDFADRRAEGYSQGQRIKTAIARALVHDPANILLDEPTNGLDVMATRALRRFVLNLRDQGRCVLLSSHVMQEIAAVCDQVVVIAAGKVVAVDSPEGLRQRTGEASLEDAFVHLIGSAEGLAA